jgi:hypothetical protein
MPKPTATLSLAVAILLSCAVALSAAERTVLAEMFGGHWCGYCPTSEAALVILLERYAEDEYLPIYYHVGPDPFATPETNARAGYYTVGGVPHVRFAGVYKAVGLYSTVQQTADWYATKIDSALMMPTPITIDSHGEVGDDGTGWVTAAFTAVDTVFHANLTAQFILYEDKTVYNWVAYRYTVRDMLAPEILTLSDPGDSVEVTRNFSFDPGAWNPDNVRIVVLVEDQTRKEVINAAPVPFAHEPMIAAINHADEIDFYGESTFVTTLKNAGAFADTITTDVAHLELPPGILEEDWLVSYSDTAGVVYSGPHDWILAPGAVETIRVHVTDNLGTVQGRAITEFTAQSGGNPDATASAVLATFVDLPSILIIDDDYGATHQSYLVNALADTGYPGVVWDCHLGGRPGPALLQSFWAVFWTTADGNCRYFGPLDEQRLMDYLDGGGNLFMASENYLSGRTSSSPTVFAGDYLRIGDWDDDEGANSVWGVPDDVISDGMVLDLSSGPIAATDSDYLKLDGGAVEIFTLDADTLGLRVEQDDWKAVFLSFPFEAVQVVNPTPNNQRALARRVVDWFKIGTGVDDGELPTMPRLALGQNVPNPFNPTTRISFSVPEGVRHVDLTILDVSGRIVRRLVDGALSPGEHARAWDGRNEEGASVASGVYFLRLEVDDEVATRKMTLLK